MNAIPSIIDGQFVDSYGDPVKHGSKILIEGNYNWDYLNGKEAVVEWDTQRGMYQYVIKTAKGQLDVRADFWGISKFKLIQ